MAAVTFVDNECGGYYGEDDYEAWRSCQRWRIELELGTAGILLASSIYGLAANSTCRDLLGERQRARDVVRALTASAAAAAIAGDCVAVNKLDSQVLALDADFHAAVFLKTVGIAQCLHRDPILHAAPSVVRPAPVGGIVDPVWETPPPQAPPPGAPVQP